MQIQDSSGTPVSTEEIASGAIPPGVAKTQIDGVEKVKVPLRPSLDVAIETLGNLSPKVKALCGRLDAWETNSLSPEETVRFRGAVGDFRDAAERLQRQFVYLKSTGYVAVVTPSSRNRSKLVPGAQVTLKAGKISSDISAILGQTYYGTFKVENVLEKSVMLSAEGKTFGPIQFSAIDFGEKKAETSEDASQA